MADIKLTGISIGYDNNLIYECSNPSVMEEFKSFLDSTELKRVDKVLLWFDTPEKHVFLVAEPVVMQDCNDRWIIKSEDIHGFELKHAEGMNLYDEIESFLTGMLMIA